VTLEPCSHQGRTPPCADLILSKKLKRVVAAMLDPNPQAAHGGEALAAGGVRFEHGLMEEEARELNLGFVSRVTRGMPWVRMKIAMSLDGRTALADGRSQWITGPEARRDGHRWRARACAILTGIGTVKADDPRLTVREVETPRQPLKVVVDSRAETPPTAKVLEGGNVLLFSSIEKDVKGAEIVVLPNAGGKVDLPGMLRELARRGVNELHVEAGHKLNGSFVREGLVDEFLVYLAPKLIGAGRGFAAFGPLERLADAPGLRFVGVERLGDDLRVLARLPEWAAATRRIVRQNLAWAAAYNAVCVPLAVMGYMPPWLAGLGMAASSLFVVGNSARLART